MCVYFLSFCFCFFGIFLGVFFGFNLFVWDLSVFVLCFLVFLSFFWVSWVFFLVCNRVLMVFFVFSTGFLGFWVSDGWFFIFSVCFEIQVGTWRRCHVFCC